MQLEADKKADEEADEKARREVEAAENAPLAENAIEEEEAEEVRRRRRSCEIEEISRVEAEALAKAEEAAWLESAAKKKAEEAEQAVISADKELREMEEKARVAAEEQRQVAERAQRERARLDEEIARLEEGKVQLAEAKAAQPRLLCLKIRRATGLLGSSDRYVVIRVGDKEWRTKIIQATCPQWDESFFIRLDLWEVIVLEVWEENDESERKGQNDFLGQIQLEAWQLLKAQTHARTQCR